MKHLSACQKGLNKLLSIFPAILISILWIPALITHILLRTERQKCSKFLSIYRNLSPLTSSLKISGYNEFTLALVKNDNDQYMDMTDMDWTLYLLSILKHYLP